MGRLAGKTALVTGGSGGIGSATLRRFVEEGASVISADIDEERGLQGVAELANQGAKAEFVRCDVSQKEDLEAAVARCVSQYGRIDVLFNNAATSSGGYVADLNLDDWERSIKIMLTASLYAMQAAIPHMLEQGGGSIIGTSSVYGVTAGPGISPYTTAKAGLINLMRTTAVEYGRKGIRANCICPGVVDTPMFDAVLSVGLTSREKIADMHAIGRIIEPEEVANLALFLASDESSAITGQAIVIDGGLLSHCDLTGMPPVS